MVMFIVRHHSQKRLVKFHCLSNGENLLIFMLVSNELIDLYVSVKLTY